MTQGRPAERISAAVITLNVFAELKRLRESESYKRNDHASTTLINRDGLGTVLVALPAGGRLREHRTARPIMIRVLEGRVRVELEDRTIDMSGGDITALAPNIVHRVSGLEDSAFLLTMGGAGGRADTGGGPHA